MSLVGEIFARGGYRVKELLILGTGCPQCHELELVVQEAADEAGVEVQMKKIGDIDEFIAYGVVVTPAVVMDGEVKCMGVVPAKEEIKRWLK